MHVFGKLLNILDAKMTEPQSYGLFHLTFFVLAIIVGILLSRLFRKGTESQVRRILMVFTAVWILSEIYKQIVFTFSYDGTTVTADYQWYQFPFQFCSTPMYIGLLACLTKRRVHRACCTYLASYSVFAGLCVMFYPVQVFTETIGINLQTMIWHGAMITLGIYLVFSGYLRATWRAALCAFPVFAVCIAVAVGLNELAFITGITPNETFNMFFVSPHCDPSLPVYSIVQQHVAYPWCLIIYFIGFTAASYVVWLIMIGIKRCIKKECVHH